MLSNGFRYRWARSVGLFTVAMVVALSLQRLSPALPPSVQGSTGTPETMRRPRGDSEPGPTRGSSQVR